MKTTTLVLGIIAGVFGILGAVLALAVGGIASELGGGSGGVIIALLAMAAAIFGIVGAGMSNSKPGFSAFAMVVAAIAGVILTHWYFVVAAPLFLIGGVIAYMARNEMDTTAYASPDRSRY